jgi:hypothetical protein
MMFTVEPQKFTTISELPNAWNDQNYKELLEQMDFDDISGIAANELKEMCMMSLTDNEPAEAAKIVLEYLFSERLTPGQIDNLSNEMLDEMMWEEYADLSLHEEFFNATQFLYEAFNGKFPHPEAVRFQVKVTANKEEDLEILKRHPEAPLIRLLVNGMPRNTLINRLFEDQLSGEEFKEAKDILWQLKMQPEGTNAILFDIISSEYWFRDFKYVEDFEADTHPDA